MIVFRIAALIAAAFAVSACGAGPDAAVRSRIASPAPLTGDEIARLLAATGRAMSGKTMRVRQGGVPRQLTDREQAQIADVLADPRGVDDVGLKTVGETRARGLRVPATPPQSEIEAASTVWIDVASLLPCRYEFAYAAGGFGDMTLDLTFERTP